MKSYKNQKLGEDKLAGSPEGPGLGQGADLLGALPTPTQLDH